MKSCLAHPYPLALLIILVATCATAQQPAWPPDPPVVVPPVALEKYSIHVVSGQNGANVIKRRVATVPVVEIRDHNNRPVAGVVINFTAPDMGPSVTFLSGSHTFSAVTELNGRARASGMLPNAGTGNFTITVTARYDDRIVASANINQINYETAADAEKAGATVPGRTSADGRDLPRTGLSRGAITAIVIAIAAGAAAGVAAGVEHK